ncbi:MAG: hypothetical protein HON48_14275 [Desulfobacula sp.]|nr:hypothetical protein [Desulfobacula sp.]
MSGTAIARRGGTTTEHASFTGINKEITVDTTKKALVVHDGVTAGGFPAAREDHTHTLAELTGPLMEIGTPGAAGFGVGICPEDYLPTGMTPMAGYDDVANNNYGNYQYPDGSVMVFVPKFFYKIGTGSNGLDINVIDVKPASYFGSTAEANSAGYALHRAFIDDNNEQIGFFVDKYKCSKRAWGTGYIASSIASGLPISTASTHNPIADLTACGGNYYYEAINAAHARDGVNGAVNASSIFFVKSQFINSALAILSMAHGQAATATTYCAWYDATYNYPKGCNDNALGDTDDGNVSYTSDGYSNCGKTGSGVPFAKTTHNGQACGVADLNGLMYEIMIGVTCIAAGKTITAATNANPCKITAVGHGRATGDPAMITSVGGMTEINDKIFTITVVDADNFTLDGVDSTAFAAYSSGGSATVGDFYVAKDAAAMKDFTSGNSLSTDHWGATGVAAMMDAFDMMFETGYSSNGFAQRMGSGANQVLSEAVSGNPFLLTCLGVPKDSGGVDTTGANIFGKDYFYQKITNELCVLSGGSWGSSSSAGVWSSYWTNSRTYSDDTVGFRCACYPV